MTDQSGGVLTGQEDELKPRTSTRKVFQNFSFLMGGKISGDIFSFLFFVMLSRVFGQGGVGQYSFAMAFTAFFAVFADFGLYELSIKEMSRRIGSLGDYYSEIFSLRLILSVAVFGVLLLVLFFSSFSPETKLITALIGAYQMMFTLVDGFAAVFIAHEDMYLAGLLEVSLRVVTTLGGIAIVAAGGNLVLTLATLPIVTFGQLFIVYWLASRRWGRPKLVVSRSSFTGTLREAVPYTLSTFLYVFSARVDIIFVGFFLDMAAAGVYNVAYRIVFLLSLPPYFAGVALFPLISRLYVSSRGELESLYHKALNLMILLGLPAACGLWLIAPNCIHLVFGETFAESVTLLRFLAGLLFLGCLRSIFGTLLTSCDRQGERAKAEWLAAWVAIIGNVVLIPLLGVRGAAVARVASETLVVVLLAVRVQAFLGWPRITSRLAMSGMATAAFCFPFAFFPSLSLGVAIPASVLLYAGILLLFQEIRSNELQTLVGLLKGESRMLTSANQEVS